MLEKYYKKLQSTSVKKAFYLSGTTIVFLLLILLFLFVVKIIPLVIVIAAIAIINWGVASQFFSTRFMILQQQIIEDAFKEKMHGFSLEIGGQPKVDILKKLDIDHHDIGYLASFLTKGKVDNIKITAYSVSYKQGMDNDYIYSRVYHFEFPKKPYALNLPEFDSPIVSCSKFTEVKYTERDIYLHFGSHSKEKNNIYSLFLNRYVGLEGYLERLDMEMKFINEIIEVARD